MEHKEFVRILPQADTAVLMIHGIVGTPNHFRDLIPLEVLVPREWSVYNLLLDGHGGEIEAFSGTSMEKWKQQTLAVFRELSRNHRRIFLVGHSMGTLLSLRLAEALPEKVCGLFLLACPLYVGLRPLGLLNCIKVAFGTINQENPREASTLKACGVNADKRLWRYLGWLPRILELYGLMICTRRKLPQLKVPCLALQSDKDELVSNRTAKKLERAGTIRVVHLKDSSHFYYTDADAKTACDLFVQLCEDIKKQN